MDILFASDRSVLVRFGSEMEPQAVVLRLFRQLEHQREVLNLHPAYGSLLVDFDPLRTPPAAIEHLVLSAWRDAARGELPPPRAIEIPVVYGGSYGPDLEEVARITRLAPHEVLRLHASAEYTVAFLGFTPGFPYLSGLPDALAVPRLASPRREVPGGSVAIGGSQAGVYPAASPGGWRVIGRTPLRLFDPEQRPPALLDMGDRVRFVPLDQWPSTS